MTYTVPPADCNPVRFREAELSSDMRTSGAIQSAIGDFTLIEKIGEGGMGEVWRARDTRLGRLVALKLLPANHQSHSARERFLQEARAVSALNHPNIVTIFEVGCDGERDYIAMELIQGRLLSEVIRVSRIPVMRAVRIAIQFASGVSAAHQAGIIHRDLKPGNVMIRSDGLLKVLDFGLARHIGPMENGAETNTNSLTEQGAIVGTVAYMSPEQAEGKKIDHRSDVFSFGVVLYEMLTGERAFSGDSRASTLAALLRAEPKPVSSIVPTLPPELQRIVNRCLRKDPEKRFQTMADVRVALEEVVDESKSNDSFASPERRIRRRVVVMAVLAVSLLTALSLMVRIHESQTLPRGSLRRLTPNDGFVYAEPNISRDGGFVVYVSNKSGNRNLWLQHTRAGDALQITHSSYWVGNQTISSDSSHVIYQENLPEGNVIRRVSILGGQPETLVNGSFPLLSPDGSQFAYFTTDGERRHLFVRPVVGGTSRELHGFAPRARGGRCLLWATPKMLLCTMPSTGDDRTIQFETFLVPVDGSAARKHEAQSWLREHNFELRSGSATRTSETAIFSARRDANSPFHLWQANFRPTNFHFQGPPTQLTFGSVDESFPSATDDGVVAFSNQLITNDFYWLPLDAASGEIQGSVRRLTHDNRQKELSTSGSSADASMFYVYGPGASADMVLLDGRTAVETSVGATRLLEWFHLNHNRATRQIVAGVADSSGYSVRLYRIADGTIKSEEKLCTDCTENWMITPDWRQLVYSPARDRKSLYILDLATRQSKKWVSHPDYWFRKPVALGNKWISAGLQRPGHDHTESRVLIGWESDRQSEHTTWRPDPAFKALPTTWLTQDAVPPHYYYFQKTGTSERLMHFHMDPDTLTLTQPQPVLGYEKLAIRPTSSDLWNIGPDGIVFQHAETKGDVWLYTPDSK